MEIKVYKTFKDLGFEPGDKVLCVESKFHAYTVGKTYVLKEYCRDDFYSVVIDDGWNGSSAIWEKVEEMEYEDQWHLNDGKVNIPDDADKLEKDSSVVAFRKRKRPEFKFGDMVKHKKNGHIYVVVGKDQEGVHRVISENGFNSVTAFTDNLTKIEK